MNDTTDPWESAMSRALDTRVRDLPESPLTFEQVRGRAVRIRRNRRLAGAGAVLAAAVIVPVAVLGGQGLVSSGPGPGPADAPTGDTGTDDGFAYVEGRVLHLSDGATVRLPERYDAVHAWGDRLVGVRNDDETGHDHLDFLETDGELLGSVESTSGVVTTSDHATIAYQDTEGDLVARWDGGTTVLATDQPEGTVVAGLTGGPDCLVDGCQVYFEPAALDSQPRVADGRGEPRRLLPEDVAGMNDVHDSGLVAVQTRTLPDNSGCGGVFDTVSGRYLLDTCDSQALVLSPTGERVTGADPYGSGVDSPDTRILDVHTGRELARFVPQDGDGMVIGPAYWEDDDHVLLTVRETAGWFLVRLGVDGEQERVLGPSDEGDEYTPAYRVVQGS